MCVVDIYIYIYSAVMKQKKQNKKVCVCCHACSRIRVCCVCVSRWVFKCKVLYVGVCWVNRCCVFMIKVYRYSGGIIYIYIYIYMHLDMKNRVCACLKNVWD